jgi:hypothetical protein
MSFQVKTFGQCQLRDKKKKNHPYVSIVSFPTDSVIVDHPVYMYSKFVIVDLGVEKSKWSCRQVIKFDYNFESFWVIFQQTLQMRL